MFRRKKKHKPTNSKRLEQQRAECRHKFFERIDNILAVVDGSYSYRLIPKNELDNIYASRGLPFKVIAAEGCEIPPDVFNEIRMLLNRYVNDREVPLTAEGDKISVYEMFTIGLTLLSYLRDLKGDEHIYAPGLKELYKKFIPYETVIDNMLDDLYAIMSYIGLFFSSFGKKIYWLKPDFKFRDCNTAGVENIIIIHCHIPEQIHIIRDEKTRRAVRLCWASSYVNLKYCTVNSRTLGIDCGENDAEINVYIQMHALQRLDERLDCIYEMYMNMYFVDSMVNIKLHKHEDDIYFIEYRIEGIKVGYLVADLDDGRLIIRTFLFITQNGTPEGKKLSELYGLCKLDKSYIALDKLSTYVTTDLCVNTSLKEVFQQAGCQYLLDICTDEKIKRRCDLEGRHSYETELIKFFGFDRKEAVMH